MLWERFFPGFRAPFVAGLLSCIVVLIVTPWVQKLAFKYGAVDDPTRDERRVHKVITPRWGGLAITAGILVSILAILPFAYPLDPFPPYLVGLIIASLLLMVIGAWDDKVQLSAKFQMAYLIAIGIGIQFLYNGIGRVQIQGFSMPDFAENSQIWVPLGIWAIPLTAFYIFVVTKTMDTIDGIDGLAAGISAIAATTLAVIAVAEEQPRVAIVAMAIAGASIGFLRYNWHPARIFMAGGAQVIGFLLASLSVVGAIKTAALTAVIIPLVFGIPIIDAIYVMTRRILSKQPLTKPDKRHLHHTLLGQGFTQKQAVWILYLAAITLSGLVLFLVRKYG